MARETKPFRVMRPVSELDKLEHEVRKQVEDPSVPSRFCDASFEDGVIETLDWLSGRSDDHPYPGSEP